MDKDKVEKRERETLREDIDYGAELGDWMSKGAPTNLFCQ